MTNDEFIKRARDIFGKALPTVGDWAELQAMSDELRDTIEAPLRKELEQMRASHASICRQRDEAERRLKVTEAQMEKFIEATATLTIERMELQQRVAQLTEMPGHPLDDPRVANELARYERERRDWEIRSAEGREQVKRLADDNQALRVELHNLKDAHTKLANRMIEVHSCAVEIVDDCLGTQPPNDDTKAVMQALAAGFHKQRIDGGNELRAAVEHAERLITERNDARSTIDAIGKAHDRGVAEWRAVHKREAEGLPPTRADLVRWLLVERENLTEQLRVADGDRVPLRMDLDDERAARKITEPLIKVAQQWRASRGNDTTIKIDSSRAALDAALCVAVDSYEQTMADFLNGKDAEEDDGFANAAANEGARIAAEARAERES